MCILLAYLSGLFCPSDCLILIIFYLSFGQERPNVGTWPKCILFLSLPPRWRVCLFLSYPLFWPSPVSVCSSNRTKDHAIAESDRSDRTNTELKRLTSLESLFAAELQQYSHILFLTYEYIQNVIILLFFGRLILSDGRQPDNTVNTLCN